MVGINKKRLSCLCGQDGFIVSHVQRERGVSGAVGQSEQVGAAHEAAELRRKELRGETEAKLREASERRESEILGKQARAGQQSVKVGQAAQLVRTDSLGIFVSSTIRFSTRYWIGFASSGASPCVSAR